MDLIWSSVVFGKSRARLAKISVALPFDLGKAEWRPDDTERRAAWALYVELVTRISVQELPDDKGLVREALNSLYSLFGTTRHILRDAGPDVGACIPSVGGLAIGVLNNGLRPFLSKWHPMLLDWEGRKPVERSAKEHEHLWEHNTTFRSELRDLREELERYAVILGKAAGIGV